jgi:hypothetical protein
MGYCDRCGVYADLDQAAMCGTCRAAWRPSAPAGADLGTRRSDRQDLRVIIRSVITRPCFAATRRA